MENSAAESADLLKPEEVAALLRLDEMTLKRWRMDCRGPKWIKMGDAQNSPVRYDRADVMEFISSRKEGEGIP